MTTQLIGGLTVEVDGEGDALLCIHGLGGSSNLDAVLWCFGDSR
jgi:hypothetical protein